MDELRSAVRRVLNRAFAGSLPDNQPQVTAFSMLLALEFGGRFTSTSPVLVGAPKKEKTKQIIQSQDMRYEHMERMVDFLLVDRQSETLDLPVLTCESEACGDHSPYYGFSLAPNWKGKLEPANGYVWDFRKMLHFRAPHLLFVGRAVKNRHDKLKETLVQCAREYRTVWTGSHLHVVLLPCGRTERRRVQLGKAFGDQELTFKPLDLSAVAPRQNQFAQGFTLG